MNIAKIQAREIIDSRGYPTIECYLYLEDGYYVTASVPSGMSKGKYEAFELRDEKSRLMGKGVLKAIETIENVIAPAIVGKEPDVVTIDQIMLDLDGTTEKSTLGANAMLAVSIAVIKAQAIVANLELYACIAQLLGQESVMLPFPLFNMINGGMHADNNLRIQEFMIIPTGAKNFRESIEYGLEFYHALKTVLKKNKKLIAVGDEGGLAPLLEHDQQALDFLSETIEHLNGSSLFKIALDVAASHFYDPNKKIYHWNDKEFHTEGLIALYKELSDTYPLCSIEDGLAEDDLDGWAILTEQLGQRVNIIGDDIFATNPSRIYQGILGHFATGTVIKPNQVGTVTETLQAIQLCHDHGFVTIVSHRSGETNDSFIADLVVGTSAGQIKAGGLSRGERLAKYNRLLTIEDELALSLLEDEL